MASRLLITDRPWPESDIERAILGPAGCEVVEDMAIGAAQLNDTWTGRLRIVTQYGAETIVEDGGTGDLDGLTNGLITIRITQSVLYVHAVP